MRNNCKVTIIHEDGYIVKENPKFLEKKTAYQILRCYHLNDDQNFILAIRTPTLVKVLHPDIVPLDSNPELISDDLNDDFSIPKISLCILNSSEKNKLFFVFQPIDENTDNIKFPPFVYGFSRNDYYKSIAVIKNEISKYFGINISNPKIYLDDIEIGNCMCQQFIKKATQSPNLKKIWFKFNLTEEGLNKIKLRQYYVKELIDVTLRFCRDIFQFNSQVGKNIKEANILTEFEYKTIFDSIPDMFNSCIRLTKALSGNESYDSSIGKIILKSIPDLEANFKDFIANYRTTELIPEIIKRYSNNHLLEKIVHQAFGQSAMSFDSMTIMPVQILPRYKLLSLNILKETPKSHPDFFIFQRSIMELDKAIKKIEIYNTIREVSYLQKRLFPLEQNKYKPLDVNERFLVCKYNVNQCLISRSTLYLLNDLIILTKSTDTREFEKLRCKYDEFIFFPNLAASLIVYYNNIQFNVIKFSSVESLKDMLQNLNTYRKKSIEMNPEKNNSLVATEIILESNQYVPPMIDSSCCKIKSLIVAASYGTYITYDTHNQSLNAFKKIKNIHFHAKLVNIENIPFSYIYGGEKYPVPFEFEVDKFVELIQKQSFSSSEKSDCLPNTVSCDEPEMGRIHHTCCSYGKYIVIYGGYRTEKKNSKYFSSDVYFVDVETNKWFMSKPGFEVEPEPRYKHSAVVYKNLMIIHGGISCRNEQVLDDIWFYNFSDGKWYNFDKIKKNMYVIPRYGHTAVMVNQFMFIIGGLTDSKQNEQISIEKSKDMNKSNDSFTSDNNDNEINNDDDGNEDIDEKIKIQDNDNYIFSPNCYCINLENHLLFGVNVIGNYMPGLSMHSGIYDDYNQQIILFGGQYQNNKNEKYTSVFLKMSVPQFFSSATMPNGNEIKPNRILLRRKISQDLLRKNTKPTINRDKNKASSSQYKPQPSTPKITRVAFTKLDKE